VLNSKDIIWKKVSSNPNYEVSNTGEIRSLERAVKNSDTTTRTVKARIKKAFINAGYAYVQLYADDKRKVMAVHRLVAEAFIENPDNKPMVNHLNGNKLKNNACNLEWCTCSENHQHAWATGLQDREKHRERMIGTKFSKDSRYHNVSFDRSRGKWKATMKVEKKMVLQKRFASEIDAAQCVNDYILKHGLNRPLNVIR
jgi:hypothetical protein